MKNFYLLLIGLLLLGYTNAQQATNFSVLSCSGVQYTLFDELDAGKVIVIGWTMPCGACILPLKTTYNVVQSYQSTHPGRVVMLLTDDYGDTPCSSINNWAGSNGMINTLRFSNPAIRMLDYGSNGMPKVVVLGGPQRKVFYNANDAVDHVALQKAINDAIFVVTSNEAQLEQRIGVQVVPNPTADMASLLINLDQPGNYQLKLLDVKGKQLFEIVNGHTDQSSIKLTLEKGSLKAGIYFIQLTTSQKVVMSKIQFTD